MRRVIDILALELLPAWWTGLMACIFMVDEITFRRESLLLQPRFTFFKLQMKKPWRTGIRGTAAGAGRDTECEAWPGSRR
jgi:hypothetical protein